MLQFMSPKAVCERAAFSRSTLDRQVALGKFPKPIQLTERRLAFRADEVEAWMAARAEAA